MIWIALFFVALCLIITGRAVIKRQIRNTIERQSQVARGERCACGYLLSSLDMGRCPECGRVFSFNSTAEELGLTAEQLARIAEKRRQRADERPQK